jgi:hypothetical protein
MGAVASLAAAVVTAGASLLSGHKKPQPTPITSAPPAPTVGEDTTLKPGQKVNAIYTSPQGLLDTAKTGRQTLLGG